MIRCPVRFISHSLISSSIGYLNYKIKVLKIKKALVHPSFEMEVLYSEASQTVTGQKDLNEMTADVKTETMADSFSCQEDLNEMIAEIKAEKMAAGRRRRNSSILESISENVAEEDLNKMIADVKTEKMATGRRRRNSSTLESISENALAEMMAENVLPENPTNPADTKKKPTKKTFKG